MDYELLLGLSEKDKDAFKQLRQIILTDYGHKEAESGQIYRFLKARDFNLRKAESMLRNHIEWKRKTLVTMENFKMSELQTKVFRTVLITFAKEGEPVAYIDVGNADFKGLLKSVKTNDFFNGIIYDCLELEGIIKARAEKLGKRVNSVVVVANYEHFNMLPYLQKQYIDLSLKVHQMHEANFPERLHSFIAINASPAFTIGYNIVKPVISKHTQSKVKVFGHEGWKEHLLTIIDEKDLPAFLGGKKTGIDGDPFCNALRPTPVPIHCYFRSPERRLRNKERVREYTLKAGIFCDLEFDVELSGSTIFWRFETEIGDIAFGLFYRNYEEKEPSEEIISSNNVNAHLEMEEGSHLCNKRGIYILKFDNSHSWLREKKIFCEAYIKNPDGTKIIVTY